MPSYRYRALARDGSEQSGEAVAADRAAAVAGLQTQGLLPIAVDEVGVGAALPAPAAETTRRHRVGDVASLFSALSLLLESGLSISDAIGVFADVSAAPRVRAIAARLRDKVRRGQSLADAMAAEAETGTQFETLAVGMVRAGEASGELAAALSRLAQLYERRQRATKALRAALLYPGILAGLTVLVLGLLLGFVIPQFELLFREARHELPFVTRAVFGVAQFIGDFIWVGILILAAAALAARLAVRRVDLLLAWDAFLLRVPLLGKVLVGLDSERIGYVLATLIGAGVPVHDALRYAAGTVRNRALAAMLVASAQRIRGGERLAAVLADSRDLPLLLVRLIAIGEAGSNLPAMMAKATTLFEQETDSRLRSLLALVEPAMVILLGGIIAVTMVAVVSAIVDLNRLPL